MRAERIRQSIVSASGSASNPFLQDPIAPDSETTAAVSQARTDCANIREALDTARTLLAQSLEAENAARLDLARDDLRVELDKIDAYSRDADAALVVLVSKLRSIRQLERQAYSATQRDFRAVWGGLVTPSTLRAIASYLNTLASDLDPTTSVRPFAADTARSIRHAVAEAIRP